jgi:hypothetical protein
MSVQAQGPRSATSSDGAAPPRRFQYGLKTLFFVTAVVGGATALAGLANTLTMVAVAWFGVLVLAHVAGNLWGTKSRRAGRIRSELDEGPPPALPRTTLPAAARLGRSAEFGRSMVFTVVVAAVAGLGVGAMFIVCGGVPHWNVYGLVVAALSAGVLGGLLGFLLSGFFRVLTQAILEASDSRANRAGEK